MVVNPKRQLSTISTGRTQCSIADPRAEDRASKVAASRGLERHAIAHDSDDEEEGYLSERLLGTDS